MPNYAVQPQQRRTMPNGQPWPNWMTDADIASAMQWIGAQGYTPYGLNYGGGAGGGGTWQSPTTNTGAQSWQTGAQYDFANWRPGVNHLAGVPQEMYPYALANNEQALAWMKWQQGAGGGGGGGGAGGDPQAYALQNRQLASQENQWLQQFQSQQEQQRIANQQAAYQQQLSQRQLDEQVKQWLASFGAQQEQQRISNAQAQQQAKFQEMSWGKEQERAATNDSWARSSDQFNQSLQAASNAWQQKNAAEQVKVQNQGNALAAWGRRTNPLISAM